MDFFLVKQLGFGKTRPILRVGSLDQQNHSIAFGRQGEALSRDDLEFRGSGQGNRWGEKNLLMRLVKRECIYMLNSGKSVTNFQDLKS